MVHQRRIAVGFVQYQRNKPGFVCGMRNTWKGQSISLGDLEDYMTLRRNVERIPDRFFMGINRNATAMSKFFTCKLLGNN